MLKSHFYFFNSILKKNKGMFQNPPHSYCVICPVAEKTITNMLYLPFRDYLKQKDIIKIIEKLKKLKPEIIKD